MQDANHVANNGLFFDTGDGPKPATTADWNTSLAQMAVLYPKTVTPADDEARDLFKRVRREPGTRRLVAVLASQRRDQRRPVMHIPQRREPVARPRERRARSRSTSSRGDPSPESDLAWRRAVAACSDDEITAIVRSFNAVDRAVRGYRGRAA
jgi:hypothetical protein